MAEQKNGHRPSVNDRKEAILKRLSELIDSGMSGEDAVATLTPKQYDFLIDQDVDLDALLLTPEQLKNVRAAKKPMVRTVKAGGYNKKYPQAKMELFNQLVAFVQSQGAEIQAKPKENYRDLDFTINGTHYKIVLSNPRN